MTRPFAITALALALVAPLAPSAHAQEKPAEPAQEQPAPPARQSAAMVPLKLDIVIVRQAGEKKISSLPYSMWVTANTGGRGASLRMGVSVPVPTTSPVATPGQSYTYRDVGTNIDVSASTAPEGRYLVQITLSDSGLNTKDEGAVAGRPVLRNFTSVFFLLLRDGQTATYTSATDPVTGETLNVQVTLSVLK